MPFLFRIFFFGWMGVIMPRIVLSQQQQNEVPVIPQESSPPSETTVTATMDRLLVSRLVALIQDSDEHKDDVLVTLVAMELHQPYVSQVRYLFDETDIHRNLLEYIHANRDATKVWIAIKLLESLTRIVNYSDNDYDSDSDDHDDDANVNNITKFSFKFYYQNVQGIVVQKIQGLNFRQYKNQRRLLIDACKALGNIFQDLSQSISRGDYDNPRMAGLFVEVFALKHLQENQDCEECVYYLLQCLHWRLVFSRQCLTTINELVLETDLMGQLLSVAVQYLHKSDRIPIQVLETFLFLVERGQALFQIDQDQHGSKIPNAALRYLRETEGWLHIAQMEYIFKSTWTPGCKDHFRYRYELASTLLRSVLLDDNSLAAMMESSYLPLPAQVSRVCDRFVGGTEVKYEPMGPDGPYRINNEYMVASMIVTSPFRLLISKTILSHTDSTLSSIKGMDLPAHPGLVKQFCEEGICEMLPEIMRNINPSSSYSLYYVIFIAETLASPSHDRSCSIQLYKRGLPSLIAARLQETGPDNDRPILTHGFVAIGNILGRMQSSGEDVKNNSEFFVELACALQDFMYRYRDCEECVFSGLYCLQKIFKLTRNQAAVRHLVIRAGIVEHILGVALQYLDSPTESHHVHHRIPAKVLDVVVEMLIPQDTASNEIRLCIRSSSGWLDLISISQAAKDVVPPRHYEIWLSDVLIRAVLHVQ